jgi:hypothetical protein
LKRNQIDSGARSMKNSPGDSRMPARSAWSAIVLPFLGASGRGPAGADEHAAARRASGCHAGSRRRRWRVRGLRQLLTSVHHAPVGAR